MLDQKSKSRRQSCHSYQPSRGVCDQSTLCTLGVGVRRDARVGERVSEKGLSGSSQGRRRRAAGGTRSQR